MLHADYCAQFIPPGGSLLDVGAGSSRFAAEMAQRGFKVSGIEINPAYIIQAEALAKTLGVTVDLNQGNAEQLPYENSSFDFSNCAEVTEHVENPLKVCQEIYRVLKPHGLAYVSFHNRWGIFDYHYHLWFINWLPRAWAEIVLGWLGKNKPDGVAGRQKLVSMHYYTYSQVHKMLKNIGFTVRDTRIDKIQNRYGLAASIVLLVYILILRPLYFNTFHVLAQK